MYAFFMLPKILCTTGNVVTLTTAVVTAGFLRRVCSFGHVSCMHLLVSQKIWYKATGNTTVPAMVVARSSRRVAVWTETAAEAFLTFQCCHFVFLLLLNDYNSFTHTVRPTYLEFMQVRPGVQQRTAWDCCSRFLTGWMPFLSPTLSKHWQRVKMKNIFYSIIE